MAGRFGTVLTAMATPFLPDGSLDLPGAERLADHLAANGSDGLVVAGSTGEAPTLRRDEKDALFRAVVGAVSGRAQVVCGTGTNDTAESIELTRLAAAAGADGILLVTPYYNRPPQRGLVEHFRAVAAAADLPAMLYNVPGRTATRIDHATLLALLGTGTIVAVKDSTGDLQAASRLAAELPDGAELYCGDDWAAFAMACLGAVGVVSVASHLVGAPIARMFAHVEAGRLAEARAIHRDLTPLFDALFVTSNPIPLKAALAAVGLPGGAPRAPLLPATDAERGTVEEALRGVGLL
jgi:4-hydroxy-tetrahydrodipicolinate synthase